MSARRVLLAALWPLVLASWEAAATELLDRLDDALQWESPGKLVRVELGGRVDVEGYWIDQRPPGLIFADDEGFVNPRLVLLGDAWIGRRLYAFVQARVDRGFDPGQEPDGDARADEYLLRYTPFDGPVVSLQVGKFATVVGNWVLRHDAWANPFVTAPLPYERVTAVGDGAAPDTPAAFLVRRRLPDEKEKWVPVIWGPSYASGVAVFGRTGALEYAAEMKNAALSSRPGQWDGTDRGWNEPTASGRVGVRPSAAWAAGLSASSGPYLRDAAGPTLAPGDDTGDFRESVVGADLRWSWRHLELWAEVFAARFEVPITCGGCRAGPRTDDADTLAYYAEGRYRLTPNVFAALRWNQQVFGDVDDARGHSVPWDRDQWRVDTAVTYRVDRHVQAKLQYAIGRQTGSLQQGEQLVAAQVTIRF